MRRPLLLMLAIAGFVHHSCAPSPSWKLSVASSNSAVVDGSTATMQVEADQTMIVHLLVVGADSRAITFTAERLPTFATLQGADLRLSPRRQDAGEYPMTVNATDGAEWQTIELHVVVHRTNRAPRLNGSMRGVDMAYLGDGLRGECPNPAICTLPGEGGTFEVEACDPDGDAMTVDIEVVPRGQPFTRAPTYSASIPAFAGPKPVADTCYGSHVSIPIAGLVPEQSYDFVVRVADEFGAVATTPYASVDGWMYYPIWGFDQGPCTTRKCACVALGSGPWACSNYLSCCSGACDSTGTCR